MNEQTKYLLNRIAQVSGQYEAQIVQLIALIEEKNKELQALKAPSAPQEPPANP